MNIIGNTRYQFTEEILETALLKLLKRRNYDDFSVKDICLEAGINRSSFYAHYQDINDFMIKFEIKLYKKLQAMWNPNSTEMVFDNKTFIKMFTFIKEYSSFYKAFLKNRNPSFIADDMLKKNKNLFKQTAYDRNLYYTDAEMDYHLVFFGGGLKAICGRWIQNNCKESPEEMAKIIQEEYLNNSKNTII